MQLEDSFSSIVDQLSAIQSDVQLDSSYLESAAHGGLKKVRLKTQDIAMNVEREPATFDLQVGIFARKKHA
jgi:hypothetical protein